MNLFKGLILSFSLAAPAMASIPAELIGTWEQTCRQKAVRTEVFTASSATLTETYYADNGCSVPLLSFKNAGAVEAASNQMDFRFQHVTVTLFQSSFVEDFNARAVCGFQDWEAAVEKEITGLACALFGAKPMGTPKVGDMRYGIYVIQDNRLYFGKLTLERNAMTPEKRPNELDVRFYIRQ